MTRLWIVRDESWYKTIWEALILRPLQILFTILYEIPRDWIVETIGEFREFIKTL